MTNQDEHAHPPPPRRSVRLPDRHQKAPGRQTEDIGELATGVIVVDAPLRGLSFATEFAARTPSSSPHQRASAVGEHGR
jgi:hypothetical protein